MRFLGLCLGLGFGSNGCAPLHSSKFDPDEKAIAVGIKVLTESIINLNNEMINTVDK